MGKVLTWRCNGDERAGWVPIPAAHVVQLRGSSECRQATLDTMYKNNSRASFAVYDTTTWLYSADPTASLYEQQADQY